MASKDESFVDCYTSQYPRLVKSLVLSGADISTAEDIAQEAFARALARWVFVRRGTNPAGYVYRCAFRLLYKRSPARANRPDVPEVSTATATGDIALRITIERVIQTMPLRRRSCAVLCLLLDFSPAEAGTMLGIANGTVRKHLEQARHDLRAALPQEHSDHGILDRRP